MTHHEAKWIGKFVGFKFCLQTSINSLVTSLALYCVYGGDAERI